MSLLDDFLQRKCTVRCVTKAEQEAFQIRLSEEGICWLGGASLTKPFPKLPPPIFYYANPDLDVNSLTWSYNNNHTDLPVVNYSDIEAEISREIPSPLALLTSRR